MTNSNNTRGVLLLNLGGPDSLSAVRPFLYNLFSDRDIIKLGPSFMQRPLAWLISTLRSSKSRKMYSLIGGKSPILDITKAQAKALEKILNQGSEVSERESGIRVYIGMRYWHPFIKETVKKIQEDGIKTLIVLSLYPHYSKTTTGSAIKEFKHTVRGSGLKVQYIEHWYDFSPYIDSLAELIGDGISQFEGNDFVILYSAHNLPVSFINDGDPYLEHINSTVKLVNGRLSAKPYKISGLRWRLSFQSKSGPVEWLEPATDKVIEKLAHEGCKNLFVVPVSFVSDHIETLYEIDILFKDIASNHGVNLKRCQSLNVSEKFIQALNALVMTKISGVET